MRAAGLAAGHSLRLVGRLIVAVVIKRLLRLKTPRLLVIAHQPRVAYLAAGGNRIEQRRQPSRIGGRAIHRLTGLAIVGLVMAGLVAVFFVVIRRVGIGVV